MFHHFLQSLHVICIYKTKYFITGIYFQILIYADNSNLTLTSYCNCHEKSTQNLIEKYLTFTTFQNNLAQKEIRKNIQFHQIPSHSYFITTFYITTQNIHLNKKILYIIFFQKYIFGIKFFK